MDHIVRRGVLLGVATCALLLGATAAAVANTDTSNFAGYGSTAAATKVSAWIRVPTVTCDGVASRAYAGQSLGVQLIGAGGIRVVADLRTYCHGSTPNYQLEFVIPKNTNGGPANVFRPSGLAVAPGDALHLTVSTRSGHARVTAIDGGRKAQAQGMPLANALPYVVATTISATAAGKPLMHGEGPASPVALPGPVSSTDAAFGPVTIDGTPVRSDADVTAYDWVNGSDQTVAATVPGSGSRSFRITFTP